MVLARVKGAKLTQRKMERNRDHIVGAEYGGCVVNEYKNQMGE
jgi:hypothetical protein